MTAIWPDGVGLVEFAEIDSTNEEARRRAASGEPGPLWLRADRQTAGRGRRGRAWESPSGNLAATLLLRPDRPAAECAQLSFVAALAAAETVEAYAGSAFVKWPNDVLVGEAKIAGVLLESAGNAVPHYLAIGIGMNLAAHPQGTAFPATSLAALGCPVPPAGEAMSMLAARFAASYAHWRAQGFAAIRAAWLGRAARLGQPIIARLSSEERHGVFEGLDETGALLLRERDGLSVLAAADVYFGS